MQAAHAQAQAKASITHAWANAQCSSKASRILDSNLFTSSVLFGNPIRNRWIHLSVWSLFKSFPGGINWPLMIPIASITSWKFCDLIMSQIAWHIQFLFSMPELQRCSHLIFLLYFLPWCKKYQKNQGPKMLPRACQHTTPLLGRASARFLLNMIVVQWLKTIYYGRLVPIRQSALGVCHCYSCKQSILLSSRFLYWNWFLKTG